jgi:type IV secretion system protein VirD4
MPASTRGLRTLFLIDEMPALGPLEDAFGLVRGYKVQIAGICQDLAQLKALYKERWASFLANAGVEQTAKLPRPIRTMQLA